MRNNLLNYHFDCAAVCKLQNVDAFDRSSHSSAVNGVAYYRFVAVNTRRELGASVGGNIRFIAVAVLLVTAFGGPLQLWMAASER